MTRYTISPDAACAVVDDGSVVLNMRTKRYYSLNETGSVIWAMLEDDGAVADIVARLIGAYEVDPLAASDTVERLLHELATEALIVAASA
jgi:hypothetical protein